MLVYGVFAVVFVLAVGVTFFLTKKFTSKPVIVQSTELNNLLTVILEETFNSTTLSSASQSIADALRQFYNIKYVTIFIANGNILSTVSSNTGFDVFNRLEQHCNEMLSKMGTYSAKVARCEGTVKLTYPTAEARGISFCMFAPLEYNGKLIGAVLLENTSPDLNMENLRYELYDKIFKSTALVLQNVLNTERLRYSVSRDQLTGVYNRRFIDETLEEQVKIHKNLGVNFNIALMDIDFFKKFNDTYGHLFGDIVLKSVAGFLDKNCGEHAWVARYGGEEFLLFFARSKTEDVYRKVDKLREGISRLKLSDGEREASVTASFGIACFPLHSYTPLDLIEKADQALYKSKHDGRNRVTVFSQ